MAWVKYSGYGKNVKFKWIIRSQVLNKDAVHRLNVSGYNEKNIYLMHVYLGLVVNLLLKNVQVIF